MSAAVIDDHEGHDHADDSQILGIRIGIVILMIVCDSFVLMPYCKCCRKDEQLNKNLMSPRRIFFAIASCFSAGLLMSMAFLHILPEANEIYKQIMAEEEHEKELSKLAGTNITHS